MTLKQTIEAQELLDSANVSGASVANVLLGRGLELVDVIQAQGDQGVTDFILAVIPGSKGKLAEREAPTLGIVGRLGGIGARPVKIGLVSDADGAITVLACALKLADMAAAGDQLPGDVILATHICPDAPILPHDPVPFMGSPVDIATMNRHEVHPDMEAILSIDTTRGNNLVNQRGIAISPTVKEGYILKVSPDLLRIMSVVTGRAPLVLPITTQDITPYGNDLHHINSIMQPATATDAPVVGVALTAETVVPGCGTGASQAFDIEMAARYCLEVAKHFGRGECDFFDSQEFARLVALYGSMKHLLTMGHK
ncbi:MAG: DUF1177 domain-containing protein [Anaerolineales bacterium]